MRETFEFALNPCGLTVTSVAISLQASDRNRIVQCKITSNKELTIQKRKCAHLHTHTQIENKHKQTEVAKCSWLDRRQEKQKASQIRTGCLGNMANERKNYAAESKPKECHINNNVMRESAVSFQVQSAWVVIVVEQLCVCLKFFVYIFKLSSLIDGKELHKHLFTIMIVSFLNLAKEKMSIRRHTFWSL